MTKSTTRCYFSLPIRPLPRVPFVHTLFPLGWLFISVIPRSNLLILVRRDNGGITDDLRSTVVGCRWKSTPPFLSSSLVYSRNIWESPVYSYRRDGGPQRTLTRPTLWTSLLSDTQVQVVKTLPLSSPLLYPSFLLPFVVPFFLPQIFNHLSTFQLFVLTPTHTTDCGY